jgi:hypothetical protein
MTKEGIQLLKTNIFQSYTKLFVSFDEVRDEKTNLSLFLVCFVINHIYYNSFKGHRN